MGLLHEYRAVKTILSAEQEVVIYTESRHYYVYFKKLADSLLSAGLTICYITSDKQDPLLKETASGISAHYVKWMMGFLSGKLKAEVVLMTMPDLDRYWFKRSPFVQKYIYVHHAAVSMHLQYNKHAFDHYDAIFCLGPYHNQETRKAEELYHLKRKDLLAYDYPLFSALQPHADRQVSAIPVILIAPSWHETCIFNTCIGPLLDQLSGIPCKVLVRPHPEYPKRNPKRFREICRLISGYPGMELDHSPSVLNCLPDADFLITDQSGIAFEFTFGLERPVLFIDNGLKETNPDWKEFGLEPVEISWRKQMGLAVDPGNLGSVKTLLQKLGDMRKTFASQVQVYRSQLFYTNDNEAINYITGIVKK